jgi:N-acetylmuramoyl-L-alanine amidase
MKHYKSTLIAFFALVVLGTPWFVSMYPTPTRFIDNIFSYVGKSYVNYSAAFFQEGISVLQLQEKYNLISKSSKKDVKKIRVLLVPGHEPSFGGTEYGNLKERDLNVELAENLRIFLQNNSHYEVIVSRDEQSWNPDIEKYFTDNWNGISDFVKKNKSDMVRFLSNGSMKKLGGGIIHNSAPTNVAIRLFGVNKWSNENNIDIAIHIHFNDYPRSNTSIPGKYSGFTIYVPEQQYSNSTTTKVIAEGVFKRLAKYNAVSNLPKEDDGVVEDQDLIAIGSANTLDAPSMLIEYGYIYEPQFANKEVRQATLKDLAFQTYLGIQDFFGSGNDYSLAYDTLILPYLWKGEINKNTDNKNEVLALQTALMADGVYPPKNKSKNDCPRTGKFGPCTLEALNNFQNKYSIKNEKDVVGIQTQKTLNGLYSTQIK